MEIGLGLTARKIFTKQLLSASCLIGATLSATSAFADTYTLDTSLGSKNQAFNVALYASEVQVAVPGSPASYYAVSSSINPTTAPNFAVVGGNTSVDFEYDFTLGYTPSRNGSPYVDLALTPTRGSLYGDVSSFAIYNLDGTTPTKVAIQSYNGSNSLTGSLVGAVAGDKFAIELTLKPQSNSSFVITGSVPVPGALVLFASSLLGVGFLAARIRRGVNGEFA